MNSSSERLGLARSLLALSVSFAVVLSTTVLSFASPGKAAAKSALNSAAEQPGGAPQNELKITSLTATKTPGGVLLQWRTNSTPDNVGFNVYRVKDGKRTRANGAIIPGSLFGPGPANLMRGGYSFSWLDRSGAADSVYYIESVNLQGASKLHESVATVVSQPGAAALQIAETLSGPEGADLSEKFYPLAQSQQPNLPNGPLEDQFAIAAQSALKIGVKKDGWYRVTQSQMAAAGFNPTVDIRNLRLFDGAVEVAISTSQSSGQFGASDYVEFYGSGFDTATTATRVYYLIAGTTPGKRVIGQNQTTGDDDPPPGPAATPTPAAGSSPPISAPPVVSTAPATARPILSDPIFFSPWIDPGWLLDGGLKPSVASRKPETSVALRNSQPDQSTAERSRPVYAAPDSDYSRQGNAKANVANDASDAVADAEQSATDKSEKKDTARNTPPSEIPSVVRLPVAANSSPVRKPVAHAAAASQFRKGKNSRKRKRTKPRRKPRQEHSHALLSMAAGPANFEYTALRKDRGLYYPPVLNGDKENYFGHVIALTNLIETMNTPNPDPSAPGPARLEIAIQGANAGFHNINVEFNGVFVGNFSFNGFDPAQGGNPVKVFDIPVSQLQDGANSVRFFAPGGDLSLVDYIKLTYPHLYEADAGSLKFSLGGTQTRKVDGFATRQVRLIDYTNPFNCIVIKPDSAPSASGTGYEITVPAGVTGSKAPRLLYAVPQNHFETPATISLSQPSTLHLGNLSATITSGAQYLVITHKTLLSNVTPLVNLRAGQGKIAAAVDVDDIYDEFSYGTHGPQAIRDFLSHAATNWITKPQYIVFAGDASLDPRNYEFADVDLVPTKLVDATYNETASDDWLADFDDDGVADIPVGRLPVRTPAEADLIVNKIIGYSPAPLPQSALLIADDPGTPPIFDFETGNDDVQALLPPGMPVQRVNVRLDGSQQSFILVRDAINQGRAIVNYSGHGTLDSWASSVIFRSEHAFAATNGMNNLTFVIVMDCLNGYFQAPNLMSLSEAFVRAPAGGAVAVFASSGLTTTFGQRQMELELYRQLYGAQVIPVGDAIKIAKTESFDIDVKRTWIYFGDPLMKFR